MHPSQPAARPATRTSTARLKPRPPNSVRRGSDLPRLKMLPSARADLVTILEHITRESGSLVIGRRFVGALRLQCRELSALPGTLGRARPELRPDIRSFPFRGYLIFFRYV